MKANKRIGGLFLGSLLITTSLSGCKFPSFWPQIESIEICANPNKTLVKGDVLSECIELGVIGHYSNGELTTIPNYDVDFSYVNKTTGARYSIGSEIPEAGNYVLEANYKEAKCAEYFEFSVIEDRVFVENIQIDDLSDTAIQVNPLEKQYFSFNVSPENYTEHLDFSIKDSTIARIVEINNGTFLIEGLAAGRTSLVISEKSSFGSSHFSIDIPVTTFAVYVKTIEFESIPKRVLVGYDEDISLSITPSNFTVPISMKIEDESILDYGQHSKTQWQVTGLKEGTTKVTFSAKSSETTYVKATCNITVTNGYPEKVWTEGYHDVDVSRSIEVNCKAAPLPISVWPKFVEDYDKNIIQVESNKNNHLNYFVVKGLKYGKTRLHWTAKLSATQTIDVYHDINVQRVYAESISLDCDSKLTMPTYSSKIVNVTIAPSNYSLSVSVSSDNTGVIRAYHEGQYKYCLTAYRPGTSRVKFTAQTQSGVINEYIDITVGEAMNANFCSYSMTHSLREIYDTGCPIVGHVRTLVIPIWFTDSYKFIGGDYKKPTERIYYSTLHRKLVLKDIKEAFFGSTETTGWESVSSYYEKDSGNRVWISGVVSDWYECGVTAGTFMKWGKWEQMVNDAVDWYFSNSNPRAKRSDFDADGDGYIDSVALVYGAADEHQYTHTVDIGNCMFGLQPNGNLWNTTRTANNLKDKNNPNVYQYFDVSYDMMYNKTIAKLRAGTVFANTKSSNAVIASHTFCHEMGHVFGLPDLYDTGSNNLLKTTWAGSITMQSNDAGMHDPFSLYALNWAYAFIPTDSCVVKLNDLITSHTMIILSPFWNYEGSPFDEYLAIELFSPDDLNTLDFYSRYPKAKEENWGAGIRLYHVDARLVSKDGKHLTTDVNYSNKKLAFNNTLADKVNGGANCGAYSIDSEYQNYSLLYHIRHDPEAGVAERAINYFDLKNSLKQSDFFRAGDSFDMNSYRYQFYRGSERGSTRGLLDSGYELGWSFTVNRIYQEEDESWSAIISLTRTKTY